MYSHKVEYLDDEGAIVAQYVLTKDSTLTINPTIDILRVTTLPVKDILEFATPQLKEAMFDFAQIHAEAIEEIGRG